MLAKLSPIIQRFLSIALILNGALLAIKWFKNISPDKSEVIILIAVANVGLGLAVYISGFKQRRKMFQDAEQE